MYLLDTNVLSELRKLGDGRTDANVTAWLADRDATRRESEANLGE